MYGVERNDTRNVTQADLQQCHQTPQTSARHHGLEREDRQHSDPEEGVGMKCAQPQVNVQDTSSPLAKRACQALNSLTGTTASDKRSPLNQQIKLTLKEGDAPVGTMLVPCCRETMGPSPQQRPMSRHMAQNGFSWVCFQGQKQSFHPVHHAEGRAFDMSFLQFLSDERRSYPPFI